MYSNHLGIKEVPFIAIIIMSVAECPGWYRPSMR